MVKKDEWTDLPVPSNQTQMNKYFESCKEFFVRPETEAVAALQVRSAAWKFKNQEVVRAGVGLTERDTHLGARFSCTVCAGVSEKSEVVFMIGNPYARMAYSAFCRECFPV